MTQPYFCPTCTSNRMRFNIIQQVPQAVRMDPQTGEIVKNLSIEELDAFHQPYRGDAFLVQCGVCGTIEREERFIKMAQKG
ncbi:hypothetical protein [Brevibacillus massiliensis]|uniref:hypothetical protein n=1 Tax=Brevibacillus massiliensis TaxID=1118054 RepID=UPI0002E21E3C|nr:hypothetical protein [Brevibacillus massiliensis]